MFIAHIPVGLCLARTVTGQPLTWKMILITSFGAIFPDLDLLRFYFVDNGQIHHHAYWTHLPAYWAAFIALIFLSSAIVKKPIPQILLVFLIASVSHLILDSVVGDIRWLWPLSDKGFHLVTVPASHTKWYMSFLNHWTFKLEIFISVTALFMAFRGYGYKHRQNPRAKGG